MLLLSYPTYCELNKAMYLFESIVTYMKLHGVTVKSNLLGTLNFKSIRAVQPVVIVCVYGLIKSGPVLLVRSGF